MWMYMYMCVNISGLKTGVNLISGADLAKCWLPIGSVWLQTELEKYPGHVLDFLYFKVMQGTKFWFGLYSFSCRLFIKKPQFHDK